MKIFNCLESMKQQIRLCSIKCLVLSVLSLWLIGFPGVVSAQVVDIPDPNLRAAIAEALNKAPGDAITRAEMETLVELQALNMDITDLRGIEFAINLTVLNLWRNNISDVSPLENLTNLTELYLGVNTISDISPLAGLRNLIRLWLGGNNISDISPLASLTNLMHMQLSNNNISDISPLASLTNLTWLDIDRNIISDISPLASLTHLTRLHLYDNDISDISPLASLTNLTELAFWRNNISDISPLASLTNLRHLDLGGNTISDISPLSSLINLTHLELWGNNISNIVPLIALTNLTFLSLQDNNISDIETLERLMAQGTVVYFRGNPAFETPGPKIEEGWVWLIVPATDVSSGSDAARSDRDFLSEASGGAVTEADVALNGASAGTQVGDSVWTSASLNAADSDNLNTIVRDHNLGTGIDYPVAYGVVPIESETQQQTRVYIGGAPVKVWLNGTLVHKDTIHHYTSNYEKAVPVMLMPGENLLFVAAYRPNPFGIWGAFFGFQDGTEYTVGAPGLDVNGDGQVNIIDLVWVAIFYGMRGEGLPADVNADGIVNVADFAAVAAGVDAANPLPQGMERVLLAALEQAIEIEGVAEAPTGFRTPQHDLSADLVYGNVAAALADARLLVETGDARLRKGVALLKTLLELLTEMRAIPETTTLLPNYPNPFNPETWIPYHLANTSDVRITIFDARGSVVRQLDLGHQQAGYYMSKVRAAYWDGRNELGEAVASGVYFYQLQTDNTSMLRKMLILK